MGLQSGAWQVEVPKSAGELCFSGDLVAEKTQEYFIELPKSLGETCVSRDLVIGRIQQYSFQRLANLAKKRHPQRALLALWGKPGASEQTIVHL